MLPLAWLTDLLLLTVCVAHLVTVAARFGHLEVVKDLNFLLFDHVEVSYLFLDSLLKGGKRM